MFQHGELLDIAEVWEELAVNFGGNVVELQVDCVDIIIHVDERLFLSQRYWGGGIQGDNQLLVHWLNDTQGLMADTSDFDSGIDR